MRSKISVVSETRLADSVGAVFVEVAISLPIFLLAILGVLYFSVIQNDRAVFSSAVARNPRVAVTRGDMNPDLIDPIGDYLNSGSFTPALNPLLYFGEGIDEVSAEDFYTNVVFEDLITDGPPPPPTGPATISAMPAAYWFVLAFIFQEMRVGASPGLRYPCDPLEDGSGCMYCRFLNPEGYWDENGVYAGTDFRYTDQGELPPTDRMVIDCSYQPDGGPLQRPFAALQRFLSIGGGGGGDPSPVGVLYRRKHLDFRKDLGVVAEPTPEP